MSYGIDGFAFAAESIVGNSIGARDKVQLKNAIRYSFYWGIGLGIMITLIYTIFSRQILSIFTDKQILVQESLKYYMWTIIAPVINAFCYIWDGIFIGATAGSAMRNSMLICTILIYLPLYYLLTPVYANHGLWLSLTIFMIVRGISLSLLYRKHVLQIV